MRVRGGVVAYRLAVALVSDGIDYYVVDLCYGVEIKIWVLLDSFKG